MTTLVQLNMRTFVSSLPTSSRRRQHRLEKLYMSSKIEHKCYSLCHMHRMNNGWGPYHTGTRQSLGSKDMKCHSQKVVVTSSTGPCVVSEHSRCSPIIDAPTTQVEHTTTFQSISPAFFSADCVLLLFFLWVLCLCLCFSFALYFCWMGSHP